MYERYLLAVLDESDDFVEIQDVLKRYQTLQAHNRDLQNKASEESDLNDQCRGELQEYTKTGQASPKFFSGVSVLASISLWLNPMPQDTKLKGHNEIAHLQKKWEERQLGSLVAGGARERMLEESAERVISPQKMNTA